MLTNENDGPSLSDYLECLANYQHSLSASEFSVLFMIFAATVARGKTEMSLTFEELCIGHISDEWQHGGTQLTLPTVRKAIRTLTGYGIVKIVRGRKRLTGAVYTLAMINNLAYRDFYEAIELPDIVADPSLS